MAILNSIRKRGIFLILIIALALFAFILSDVLTSGGGGMKGQANIGSINGVNIPREQFMQEVELAQRNMGPNANTAVAMNRVWDKELRRILIEEQIEKLGISVEKAQLDNALRQTLAGNPTFLNSAGEVDEGKIQEYIASIRSSAPEMYQQWIQFEKELSADIMQNTYFNMIKGGIRYSINEAELEHHFNNDKINFNYVMIPYSSIEDDLVSVSDKEIEKYIADHPEQFKTEASADVEYVLFVEEPSEEDMLEAKEEISALLKPRVEFNRETKSNDSIPGFKDVEDYEDYVNQHSDVPFFEHWFFKEDLPQAVAEEMINLEKGDVYGPFQDENSLNISRIIDVKRMPDSTDSKHILIRYAGTMRAGADITRTKEDAEKLTDSLLAVVKKTPSKFEELAKEFSDDSSKDNGGDLGTSTPGRMVPPFDEFIFGNPEGTIGKVETDFGFHIVQVGKQSEPKKAIKLANIVKSIEPSEKTLNDLFSKASSFEVEAGKGNFESAAEKESLEVRPVNKIGPMDGTIAGIDNNRSIVTWAFDEKTKVGDSRRFSVSDGYAVVRLTRKNKKGLQTAAEAGDKVRPILMNEKKAKKIRESASGSTLDEIAQSGNVSVRVVSSLSMANPAVGGVREPKVVGQAFGTKVDQTSGPIDGNEGVYWVKVTSLTPAQKLESYVNQANQMSQRAVPSSQNNAFNALKNKAKIKDNRAEFF